MKAIFHYFLILLLFASCIDDVENVEEQFPQQWNLVRMTGSDGSNYKTGAHLEWQEFYLLNPDGSFLKSRLEDGSRISATGTFSIQESEEETILVLTYDGASDIIGSCSAELEETLIFLNNSLLVGTWSACDGPGLEYFRVK
jgi:hypothetical protein